MADEPTTPQLPTVPDHVERLRQSIPGAHPTTWSATTWATLYRGYLFVAGLLGGEVAELRESFAAVSAGHAASAARDESVRASIDDLNRRLDAMALLLTEMDEKITKARDAFVELRDGKKKPASPPKETKT